MPKTPLTAEQKKQIVDYLNGYSLNKKMLALDTYEREYFSGSNKSHENMPDEIPLSKAKMYNVRHFILNLPNSDEKLFLYYHYIKGQSVPRCAELLGVSERGGFRMKSRALQLAYDHFQYKI